MVKRGGFESFGGREGWFWAFWGFWAAFGSSALPSPPTNTYHLKADLYGKKSNYFLVFTEKRGFHFFLACLQKLAFSGRDGISDETNPQKYFT